MQGSWRNVPVQNTPNFIFAPFSTRWWYCWVSSEPLCSQKAATGEKSPHSFVNHKGPPDPTEIRPFSILLHDFRRTGWWLPCWLASITLGPSPFCATALINKHSPYCNRLNKTISLIIWCIFSFTGLKRCRSRNGEQSHLGLTPKVTLELEWKEKNLMWWFLQFLKGTM